MNKQERNGGIDILRVLCMVMLIVQHLLGHGWIMQQIDQESWKYALLSSLYSSTLFGVSCFAMISGYVGVKGRYRYTTLILQWLRVICYSALFTLLTLAFDPEAVTRDMLLAGFFPAVKRQYWYFTAYVGCFMAAPMINAAMRQMNRRQAGACLAAMLIIFSGLNLFDVDPFYVAQGKNTLWLIVLYALGAYVGQFGLLKSLSTRALAALTVLSALLAAGVDEIVVRACRMLTGKEWGYWFFERNDAFPNVLLALMLLVLFERIRVRRGAKLLAFLAPLNFSVYLIHDHPLVRRVTISRHAWRLANLSNVQIIPSILLTAVGIYAVCACLDILRERVFQWLKLKRRILELEERLIGFIWD